MLIECILHRPGGSQVDLGTAIYHFAPDETGRHVADVMNEDHVDRLLAIPEGYRLARSVTAQLPAGTVEPAGSSPDPDDDDPDREELVDEYVQLTGERPDGRWSIKRLTAEIEAARKEGDA
ncbi:hypothetical protein ACRC7T_18115 [Segnochrobactraceae bacterium EtOH-i3]